MGVIETVVVALWAMLPAYVPNNAAVVFGGGPPIDGGRTMGDRRLLGDGKTWRGTVAGTVAGVAVALALGAVAPAASSAVGISLPSFPLPAAFGLALGAMLGDITASFLKRRSGRARGAAFPGLDQLDFVVGALLTAAVLAPSWVLSTFSPGALVVVLVVTPLLHVSTNVLAYHLDLKSEPW